MGSHCKGLWMGGQGTMQAQVLPGSQTLLLPLHDWSHFLRINQPSSYRLSPAPGSSSEGCQQFQPSILGFCVGSSLLLDQPWLQTSVLTTGQPPYSWSPAPHPIMPQFWLLNPCLFPCDCFGDLYNLDEKLRCKSYENHSGYYTMKCWVWQATRMLWRGKWLGLELPGGSRAVIGSICAGRGWKGKTSLVTCLGL